jgi:glycerate 2-kinase
MEALAHSAQLILKMRSNAKTIFLAGIEAARAAFESIDRAGIGCSLAEPSRNPADNFEKLITGGNGISLNAVVSTAEACHGNVLLGTVFMKDDVAAAAMELHSMARDVRDFYKPVALVCGRLGRGGCNEELALRFALLAERASIHRPWVFLSGNTKGRQGPHKSGGAILDAGSCSWMRQLGIDPVHHAASGDPSPALAASGDLLLIGETDAEASDLELILLSAV